MVYIKYYMLYLIYYMLYIIYYALFEGVKNSLQYPPIRELRGGLPGGGGSGTVGGSVGGGPGGGPGGPVGDFACTGGFSTRVDFPFGLNHKFRPNCTRRPPNH